MTKWWIIQKNQTMWSALSFRSYIIFSHIRIPDWWFSPSITSRGGRMPTMEKHQLAKTLRSWIRRSPSVQDLSSWIFIRLQPTWNVKVLPNVKTHRQFLNGGDTDWHRLFMFLGVRWCVFFLVEVVVCFQFPDVHPLFEAREMFLLRPNQNILRSRLQSWRPKNVVQTPKKNCIFATDHKGPKTDPSQGSSPDSPACFLLGSGKDSAFFSRPLGGPCLMLSDAIAKAPKSPWILSQLVSWHFGVLHQSRRECCPTQSNHFLQRTGNRTEANWDLGLRS